MKLINCTRDFIKDLYLVKVNATQRNDQVALNHLKNDYPELFDAAFLLDLLKNEFDRINGVRSYNNIFELPSKKLN